MPGDDDDDDDLDDYTLPTVNRYEAFTPTPPVNLDLRGSVPTNEDVYAAIMDGTVHDAAKRSIKRAIARDGLDNEAFAEGADGHDKWANFGMVGHISTLPYAPLRCSECCGEGSLDKTVVVRGERVEYTVVCWRCDGEGK